MPTTLSARRAALLLPVILALLSMLGPFSIDTPFPAFSEMRGDFGVTGGQMQLVVTAYLIAFGLMSPFHGPLSDAIGRRPVIIAGVAVFAVASVGCALSTSLPMLLVFRVLQGLSAGGGVIVSRTVIRDLYDGDEAQRLMSRTIMIFGLAPAVAPIIGGWLLQVGAWPVIFWFLACVGLALVGIVMMWLPETHPAERRSPLAVRPLLGSLLEVSRHAAFHRVAWAASLGFGGQFLYIGSAPILVVDLLGKGELDFWMFFVPMISGVMLGAWISGRAAGRISGRTLVTASMVFAAVGALVNVVLGMLPTAATLPWAVIGPALIAVGSAGAYPTFQLALLDMFPHSRGAAVSMFTFMALMLNGVTASALSPFVTGSVLELALAALVMEVAALLLWMWHLSLERRALPVNPEPIEPTESL